MDLLVHVAYARILDTFRMAHYTSASVHAAATGTRRAPLLILRHDAEWSPRRALAVAEIDHAHGISSTFYFRTDTRAYDLNVMRRLQDEGFEIGYHYNTLDRCGGDHARAIALFDGDLRRLREAGIRIWTVKAHGNPRIKKVGYTSNEDIRHRDRNLLRRNGLLDHDACLHSRYPELCYLSDVGIRFNPPFTIAELMSKIANRVWPTIYMATHPDYWSPSTIRALGLQVAARCLRCSRLNNVIGAARHALATFRPSTQRE